jgi:hypothetical protein
MSPEKRKIKRRHLIYYLKVMERASGHHVGFLADISTRGILIMTEKPIKPGSVLQLRMLVQSDMSAKQQLDFDARCTWCQKSINDISYDAGCELLNIDLAAFKDIEQIIADIGFND